VSLRLPYANLYCLRSGCESGRAVSLTAALNSIFPILRCIGRIKVCVSNVSIGEVQKLPVIASVPALCAVVSFLIAYTVPNLCL
jgi:hypothetical protein